MTAGLIRIPTNEFPQALVAIFDQVVHEKTAIAVENETGDRVLLRPMAPAEQTPRAKTDEDYRAFLSVAGSWRDVDTDALLSELYSSRATSTRAPVEL